MALIVEDGTGKPDAESYCEVADADAYHAKMGNTAWASVSAEDKEIALRRATQYLDAVYAFPGYKLNYNQALNWPRVEDNGAFPAPYDINHQIVYIDPSSDFPRGWPLLPLVAAEAEVALRQSADMSVSLLNDYSGDEIVTEETIGPITTKYAKGSMIRNGQIVFALVDRLMAQLNGGTVPLAGSTYGPARIVGGLL